MKLLITGSGQPLGKWLVEAFGQTHQVSGVSRLIFDHRDPDGMASRCEGVDAILHCDVFDPPEAPDEEILSWASHGTYVLMSAARSAGVERVIVASRLSFFDAYPVHYVVDETWEPRPHADASSLGPYMAELTCREFARQGGICATALRLGTLGSLEGSSKADVVTAFKGALTMDIDPHGYRWQIFHVSSSRKYPMKSARRALGFEREGV